LWCAYSEAFKLTDKLGAGSALHLSAELWGMIQALLELQKKIRIEEAGST